jgi:hypothetical protein
VIACGIDRWHRISEFGTWEVLRNGATEVANLRITKSQFPFGAGTTGVRVRGQVASGYRESGIVLPSLGLATVRGPISQYDKGDH